MVIGNKKQAHTSHDIQTGERNKWEY